jgi:hypothetical protein
MLIMLADAVLLPAARQELASSEVQKQIREKHAQRAKNSLAGQVQVAPLHSGGCCSHTMTKLKVG